MHLEAGAAALHSAPRITWAQAYLSRPARVIVGFAVGGAQDILARLTGQWLSERFGQQFVVENRLSGGVIIAAEVIVRAPADDYKLLMVATVKRALCDALLRHSATLVE